VAPELAPWVALAALPIVLAVATAFTKASVVLGALRVGLGAEVLLPWSAMTALALVLTGVVMGPVVVETLALVDAAGGSEAIARGGAWGTVAGPLLEFLGRHAAADELRFFAELQGLAPGDPRALVPAFLVTELGEALHMAVLILLPLVVVDLVVAQGLTLLGLANAPGPLVTLPLKLLLFLAVDGFDVVVRGLLEGYA
jgi:flagellar biosynthesis protein FliP